MIATSPCRRVWECRCGGTICHGGTGCGWVSESSTCDCSSDPYDEWHRARAAADQLAREIAEFAEKVRVAAAAAMRHSAQCRTEQVRAGRASTRRARRWWPSEQDRYRRVRQLHAY
jgi:hypothetical protein